MLLKCYTQNVSKFGKIAVAIGLEKASFILPKKGNAKECSNYHTIALISHCTKVILKILQARFQQNMNQANWELPDVQAGFRRGRGTRNQIANICWITEKVREFQKKTSASLWLKALTGWTATKCGKFLKGWEYLTTLPASWETYMQDKKQQWNWLIQNWERSMTKLSTITLLI